MVTGNLEGIAEPVHIMICFDVLEHIPRSSEFFHVMDSRLRPDGLLLLRTPWYSMVPHIEHLPEAEENWKQGGGEALLTERYKLLHPLEYGGVYQKNKS